MFENVTPEKAIAFVKVCAIPSCCLPLPKTASNLQIVCYKAVRLLGMLNATLLSLPLLYAVYLFREDSVMCTRIANLVFAVLHILLQTLLCMAHNDRLRWLVDEMTVYCKIAKSFERNVFQRYINKYCRFYGTCSTLYYMTSVIIVFGTLLLPQPFPTLAEYPFRVDYEPLRSIIYAHQSIVGFQVSSHICMNILGVLMLLFASARFDIVSLELSDVKSLDELVSCLKKYLIVRKYADEAVYVVQYMVLISIALGSVCLMFSGFHLIARGPFLSKVQFIFVAGTALVEVFMSAWPADNLLHASENALRGAYDCIWYQQSLKVQRTVLCTLIPQKPVAISIKCIIPMLSLNYFSAYVSNAFSIFTFFRSVMNEEET